MSLLKNKMEGLSVAELKKKVREVRKEMHRPLKGLKKSDLVSELERFAPPAPPTPSPVKVEKKVRVPIAVVDMPIAIIGKTPAKKAKVEESDEEPPKKVSRKSAPVAVPASLIVEEKKASRPAKGSEEMKERMQKMREKKGKKE